MDPKLKEMTPAGGFRDKIAAVLKDTEGKGYKPYIASGLRTKAQQEEKVKEGTSQTKKSRHLAGKDALARAADIVPRGLGWNAPKRYWFILVSSAMAHGLGCGIFFGLGAARKAKLQMAILNLRELGWPKAHPLYETAIGWDPAHVQDIKNW